MADCVETPKQLRARLRHRLFWVSHDIWALLTVLTVILGTAIQVGYAGEYTLSYQGQNKWLAATDRPPLDALIAASKVPNKATPAPVFHVVLPVERALAIQRLDVLQGILANSLNIGVTLVEIPGDTPANTLKIIYPPQF